MKQSFTVECKIRGKSDPVKFTTMGYTHTEVYERFLKTGKGKVLSVYLSCHKFITGRN